MRSGRTWPSRGSGANSGQPMAPSVHLILVALADGATHGYRIMQRVSEVTAGSNRMQPGTLYDGLKKMLALGLIEETA